ncbi:MAG TPA: heavy-metal-associated domain-containing protein [Flavobacteriales bacterium]|nr:heavy-metal-associated domain-containing protein [Flavobacteriales bacterium]
MNRFTLLISIICFGSFCFLQSCGEQPYDGEITISEFTKVGHSEKTIARLEINGMMCEVGCVAKVKKELLAQDGVSNVKIDFEKGREYNFASIEYDPTNRDVHSLSAVVNEIADGKLYGVRSVEVTYFAPAASSTEE